MNTILVVTRPILMPRIMEIIPAPTYTTRLKDSLIFLCKIKPIRDPTITVAQLTSVAIM